ncbi:hypothetical protein LINPERPRIM_LOCUS35596 [Linum perenne]
MGPRAVVVASPRPRIWIWIWIQFFCDRLICALHYVRRSLAFEAMLRL